MLGITLTKAIATILSLAQGKVEMHGKLLLKIQQLGTAYFIVNARAV